MLEAESIATRQRAREQEAARRTGRRRTSEYVPMEQEDELEAIRRAAIEGALSRAGVVHG
jgi:hypothetical protein